METSLHIFDLLRCSYHDGPGLRTVVYLQGCPLTCKWCHNPESQSSIGGLLRYPDRCIGCRQCQKVCPNGAMVDNCTILRDLCTQCNACADTCKAEALKAPTRLISQEELLTEFKKDLEFYRISGGGVTFTGGEPMLQARKLKSVLEACREHQISVAIDTCGFCPQETYASLLGLVDCWLYDLKIMDPALHQEHCGTDNLLILENLNFLASQGQRIHIHCPIIPSVNDTLAHVSSVADFLTPLQGIQSVTLLPYHTLGISKYKALDMTYPGADFPALSEETFRELKSYIASRFP